MRIHARTLLLLAALAVVALLPGGSSPASADELCPPPGYAYETSPGVGGIVNTYYPSLDATLPAGSTTLNLGTSTGAAVTVAAGDLFLIIQMQGAAINTQNDDRYGDSQGDGVTDPLDPLDQGRGFLNDAALIAGRYEYVIATGPLGGMGALPIAGAGAGAGTLFPYENAGAVAGPAGQGRKRYQVVRVPRYSSLTVPAGGLQAAPWNGSTGGILALDVVGALNFSGQTLTAAGRGFRGGLGQNLAGSPAANDADYRRSSAAGGSTIGAHGNKGEGLAGSPRYMRNFAGTSVESTEADAEGYPEGSRARGAPGNAGGGGTDGNPLANNDSAGGGGGGNGGPGGRGGRCASGKEGGGHGGAAFRDPSTNLPLWTPGRVVMGGGGGSGTKHDNSPNESDGACGGGIVLIRTGSLTGTGTISVRGNDGGAGGNDGGGGGGAGGSVILVSKDEDWSSVTLSIVADGGAGSNAGTGVSVLGPGGGGGGGVVMTNNYSGGTVTVTSAAGPNGTTQGGASDGGALVGTVGTLPPGDPSNPFIDPDLIPGADSGADCETNDLPTAVNDAYSTPQNTPLVVLAAAGVLLNDTDPDADPLTADGTGGTVPNPGTEGSVVLNADGSFTFTPVAAFVGTATFTYRATDGALFSPSYATVSIDVGNVNDPPVNTVPVSPQTIAEGATLTLSGGTALSVTDPDSGGSDIQVTLSVDSGSLDVQGPLGVLTSITGNQTDTVVLLGTAAEISAALATVVFTPESPDFAGTAILDMDSNDLGATGPGGPKSDLNDQVTIDVTPVDDSPVAVADSFVARWNTQLVEGGSGVLSNDSDIDSVMTAVLDSPPAVGVLVLNADGSFTYSPPGDPAGGVVTFTYHATDGNSNSAVTTVTITILSGRNRMRAGYCGLTGMEVFAVLGLIGLLRSRRLAGRR